MGKTAIITLYDNQNYGNRLQNLAVQTILEERGFQVESLVFMNNPYKWRTYKYRKYFKGIVLGDHKASRNYVFLEFDKKYIKMRYLFGRDQQMPPKLVSEYDFFVTGSDQVWNVKMHKKAEESSRYFLAFAENRKKICISPSIGMSVCPEEYEKKICDWLSGFQYLSCREKQGAQEIKRITGRECEWLIDPTLYISQDQWKKILSLKHSGKEPYVFLFFLDGISPDLYAQIEAYAAKGGYRIINASDPRSRFYSIDPAGFVELLSNAHIVFTDSFHVTAFSINFHIPFYVFDRNNVGNMTSRIESICQMFSLSDRYMKQQNAFLIQECCNFEIADRQLMSERSKFTDYLNRCFKE